MQAGTGTMCHRDGMKMPAFAYHRPETLAEALALLAEHGPDAKVLAGGQSLLPLMALRLSQPDHIVDIGRLDELSGLREHDGGVAIGALVRHVEVEESDLVAESAPVLAEAMPYIGHRPIRSRGTVCGSLAHADPAAELPAVALALDATFVAKSAAGERIIPAADFFVSYLTSALADDELLTEVRFPAWAATAGGSVQELSRRHGDYALVGLVVAIDTGGEGGTISRAALAFLGAGPTPVRVAEAEAALLGARPGTGPFEEAARLVSEHLDPPADNHASAAYRRHVAGVLTRRGLDDAAAKIGVPA